MYTYSRNGNKKEFDCAIIMSAIEEIWRVGEKDMPGKVPTVITSQSSHSLVCDTIHLFVVTLLNNK